jgi:hypothetical protein
MKHRDFTLPELEQVLDALYEGAQHHITRQDYERLFGANDAAVGRLHNFAKAHACAASFSDEAILFRRQVQTRSRSSGPSAPEARRP